MADRPDTTAGAAIGIAAMPGSARSIGMLGGSLAFGVVIVASVGIIAVVSRRMRRARGRRKLPIGSESAGWALDFA